MAVGNRDKKIAIEINNINLEFLTMRRAVSLSLCGYDFLW
ncbi:unnamed protein product, partial [Rotaria magnacalcarata]